LLAANALAQAGITCAVFERLSENAARARARAGLIEARTVALLDRHGLATGFARGDSRARRASSEETAYATYSTMKR
jgi:2-polyprenyl-6-methoxyphenol hydroxylase-like FAD-dependent oxidoreductase